MATKKIVRSSKFRHVFGTASKRDKCYDNIRISKSPHDSNMSAVNKKFVAVVLEQAGGGAFMVAPLTKVGRFDINYPKVSGHTSPVIDVAWNPFNDNQIASASEDCSVMIWEIPDGGISENMDTPTRKLARHQRKVQHVVWHPCAENVLASSSADNTIIVWDTSSGEDLFTIKDVHPDMIFSMSWNYDGSLLATTCKDKKIRVLDPRAETVIAEGSSHQGNKPSRVVFCGKTNKLFTTGFTRTSDRQYALWDPNDLSKPLVIENIDTGSGVLYPFWDEGTCMVYIIGKGDTYIKMFEVTDAPPYVFFLTMYQSTTSGRAMCSMPKKEMDYMKCEVMRFFKVQNNLVEPISMTVPRKSDMFQDDIYPPCLAGEPALTAAEWASGENKDPKLLAFTRDGLSPTSGAPKSAALKVAAAPRKVASKAPPIVQASISVNSTPSISLAGCPEPTTLEEYRKAYRELVSNNFSLYRKAYRELEEENRRLREKLGM